MHAEEYVKVYEAALGTQKWENVEPLIADKASVTFSDGSVHVGNFGFWLLSQNEISVIALSLLCG